MQQALHQLVTTPWRNPTEYVFRVSDIFIDIATVGRKILAVAGPEAMLPGVKHCVTVQIHAFQSICYGFTHWQQPGVRSSAPTNLHFMNFRILLNIYYLLSVRPKTESPQLNSNPEISLY